MLESRIVNNVGIMFSTGVLSIIGFTSGNRLPNYVAIALCGLGLYNTAEIKRLEVYQDTLTRLRHKKTALMLSNYLEQPITASLGITEEQQKLYLDIARLGLASGKDPLVIIRDDWGLGGIDEGVIIWQQLLPDTPIKIPGV